MSWINGGEKNQQVKKEKSAPTIANSGDMATLCPKLLLPVF